MMMREEEGETKQKHEVKSMDRGKKGLVRAMLDTGATISACEDEGNLNQISGANIVVQGVNSQANYKMKGTLEMSFWDMEGKCHNLKKEGVIVMPGVGDTIFSYNGVFKTQGWGIDDTGTYPMLKKIGSGERIRLEKDEKGLIYVYVRLQTKGMIKMGKTEDKEENEGKTREEIDINIFHSRCGHLKDLKELRKQAGILKLRLIGELDCKTCLLVDSQKIRIRSIGESRSFIVGGRIFMDIMGPLLVRGEHIYLMVIVDDASRMAFGSIAPAKSARVLTEIVKNKLGEIQKYGKIRVMRIDQGKEWWNRTMEDMLSSREIRMEGTGPDMPENNSVAEGKIWRSFKKLLKLLWEAGCVGEGLTVRILKEAWNLAIYFINREGSRANTRNASPMEVFKALTGRIHKKLFTGAFGEMVIINRDKRLKSKLEPKGEWGVIIGIDETIAGKKGDDGAAVIMKMEREGGVTKTQNYEQTKTINFYWKEEGHQKDIKEGMEELNRYLSMKKKRREKMRVLQQGNQ